MPQINDVMHQGLTVLGFNQGALADQVAAFKAANAPWAGWSFYLESQGFTDGALSDRKLAYFESLVP